MLFALPETAMTTASSGNPGKRKPRPPVTRPTARERSRRMTAKQALLRSAERVLRGGAL